MANAKVQVYFLPPTADSPNNPLPVIHYQGVLPQPSDEEATKKFLTKNHWEHRTFTDMKKGTWGHIGVRHFHPNTHECYGIFQGHSTMLLGKISDGSGKKVNVSTGDVIVLPAGTAHSSLESSENYRYIGVYPEAHPRWINEHGKTPSHEFRGMIREVEMPAADPVFGESGPLMRLWKADNLARL